MRNKVYSVSGGNFECKVLAKDTKGAADQTDKMQESEVAFVDDWMKEHKEQPIYADAIAWAEKKMFEDAFA